MIKPTRRLGTLPARFSTATRKLRRFARRPARPRRPDLAAPPTLGQVALAWSVHLYTAMGLVCAAGIARALLGTEPDRFKLSFLLMLVATLIDATDGFLARRFRVREVVPQFDGRRLDDIVDFLNYTFLPLVLLYRAELLPGEASLWLLVPLLASAYGFCQVSAKTEDGFFLGFPSYWNLAAFYLYLLRPPVGLTIVLLVTFAGMTFLPTRYLYPTQPGRLNRWANALGVVWGFLLLGVLFTWPTDTPAHDHAWTRQLCGLSLVYPVFYLAASWVISIRLWLARRATI